MDDEDIYEDISRESSLKNEYIFPAENKASKDRVKFGENQPIFVGPIKPTKVPQIPLYRPTQPTINETNTEKVVDKEVMNVFSNVIPGSNYTSSEKSFGHEYFEKDFSYANNSLFEYKVTANDPDNKSHAMNSARSNVSNMRGSVSAITNQKLESTRQPEYGGYELMKEKIQDSTLDNRVNKVYARHPGTADLDEPRNRSKCCGSCKSKAQWFLWALVILLLLLILGFLLYYFISCKTKSSSKDNTTTKTCEPTTAKSKENDVEEGIGDNDFSLISAESLENMESNEKLSRLHPAVFPTAYYITIISDLNEFVYDLRVHILIYVNEITNLIVIHGSNYNLNAYVGLIGPDNEMYDIATVNLEVDTELMVLTLNRSTVIGEYNLTMHYSGVIETEIGGYYRISYISPDTKNVTWLALTDFKPNKAHLLFPCFDHPMFKATFSLVFGLLDSKSFTISNMAKVEQRWKRDTNRNLTETDVHTWDHYDTTPLMPSMGLAFITLPNKDDFSVKDINYVHFIYRKNVDNETEFAMDWSDKILNYFEVYFNSLYSLPNLHIFSVPNLNAYGVGSWGIILLSESQISNNPKDKIAHNSTYPIEQGKQVILNLSHKIVTQWFGTGVTMSDFSEEWIFEGFAIYMKYRTLNALTTEWTDPGHFIVEVLQPLMLMESLIPTVKYHENHQYLPNSKKGAVLMHMMETMITKDTFDMAMMKLTDNKKLQVASYMDICELLSDEAQTNQTLSQDLNLCDFLKPYVNQRGYPVIQLSRNYITNGAMITQQPFVLGAKIGEKFSESNDTMNNLSDVPRWIIPTSIINKGCHLDGSQPKTWMPQKEEFSIGILTSNDWALLNDQATGLYRVNYDKRNWDMIKKQLETNYTAISTINRAQIIDDVLNLARANLLDYYLAFEVMKYISTEKEYIPWVSTLNNLKYFDMMLLKTPQYGIFKKFASILIHDVYQTHCNEKVESNEGTYAIQLHNLINDWACHLDHPACTEYSIREFYAYMAKPQENYIAAEERYTVYCTAIRSTTYKEWEFLWNQYLKSDNQFEKELILKALACTYDPWIIELYLWYLLSSTTDEITIQPIHYTIIIEHLSKNPVASSTVLYKTLKNWKLFRKLSVSNTILSEIIKSSFFYVNTEYEFGLFKNWSRTNADKMTEDYELFQHIEAAIENNIFFMKTYLWQVVTWMQNYVKNNTDKLPVSCGKQRGQRTRMSDSGNDDSEILGMSPIISRNNSYKNLRIPKILPESPFVSGYHALHPIDLNEVSLTSSRQEQPPLSTVSRNVDKGNVITVTEIPNVDKKESTLKPVDKNKIEGLTDDKKDSEDAVIDEEGRDLEHFVDEFKQTIPEKKEEVNNNNKDQSLSTTYPPTDDV